MKKAALLLLVIAGHAAAQPTPQPQQAPERKAAPSEPRLNLRLDESDLRSLSRNTSGPTPSEEKSVDGLPSLGGDVRPIERTPTPIPGSRRPYPQDSERIN